MKALRALLLVLALSVCAYAGNIECDKTGDMPNGVPGDQTNGGRMAVTDPVTEIALQLLQSVLPLF